MRSLESIKRAFTVLSGARSVRSMALLFMLLLALAQAEVNAQEPPASVVADSLNTSAGELKIVAVKDGCKFNVTLNGKIVVRTDCDDEKNVWATTPIPGIHTYYKSQGVRPFVEVVLLQMGMLGNACDGGPLLFVGLKEDKTFALSASIDFCGGRPPVVTWSSDKVTVLLPGGPPNRGDGYLPAETWVYENGRVRPVKRPKR
ncbi:MAG TPA: hypothetical protein VMS31_14350 [Pyrinomonadaceae bacterium]|nr:hypothetical protein [Pyrinomonadaceae bacterium]